MVDNKDKSLDDILLDIKDDLEENQYDLDDVDYYLYDRNEWVKKLIQRDGLQEQDYDTDIHTIGELIYQLWRLKKIIYENSNKKYRRLSSQTFRRSILSVEHAI